MSESFMDLTGRTAIVTGGNSGIGAAITDVLNSMGAAVTTLDRAPRDSGGDGIASIVGDVTSEQDWEDAVASVTAQSGSLDILVQGAGVGAGQVADPTSVEGWEQLLRVNLIGMWLGIRTVLPLMRSRGYGRIVNIGALAARSPFPTVYTAPYSASKAGVEGLSKTAALESAQDGVTVNVIAPGSIATPMTDTMPDSQREKLISRVPSGTWGQPTDAAWLAAFLASDHAGYITGQVVDVDGGLGLAAIKD